MRGENTCSRCGGSLDPDSDHYALLSQTSVDVQTAAKETTEQLFCADCLVTHLDLEPLDE